MPQQYSYKGKQAVQAEYEAEFINSMNNSLIRVKLQKDQITNLKLLIINVLENCKGKINIERAIELTDQLMDIGLVKKVHFKVNNISIEYVYSVKMNYELAISLMYSQNDLSEFNELNRIVIEDT